MAEEIKWSMTVNGKTDDPDYQLVAALIEGGINEVPTAMMEFTARNKALDLAKLAGTEMGFWIDSEDGKRQRFWGTCISAEAKGAYHGGGHYLAEIKPWLWFLTRSKNNRIFQERKAEEIIKDVIGEYGFGGDLKMNHSGTDPVREYCVQYGETDLNFIGRLLEEEGYYFYFEFEDGVAKMIVADMPSGHTAPTKDDKFLFADENADMARELITRWENKESVVTGKVTLRDYDFTKPTADLTATSNKPSGDHGHKSYEVYDYPGRYTEISEGEKRAAALVEASAAEHQRWIGEGTIANLTAGKLFEIVDHPRHTTSATNGFMVTKIKQLIRTRLAGLAHVESVLNAGFDTADAAEQYFFASFEAILKSNPFRMPTVSERPYIGGLQTAIVTGASGDEIAVDEYGRIKVQFHWDRKGKKDDRSSCWVRTVMPWTGSGWGMVSWPRVGQEVVIQFLEGDPDRPICTGMLYNADTMPPYELPANATRTGFKTNSSKGGGGYNELMIEDKKGEELVRFMAEKDYVQNVQNQSHVKVGYDHQSDVKKAEAQADKSMKLEVKEHLDELVESGDHSFEVKTGKQTLKIKKDKTETVEGKVNLTVTKDKITKVKQGNVDETVDMGNKSTKVKMGNIKVDADMGKIDITAMQSITLKVGASEVKLDQSGVTIKGIMVKVQGSAMLETNAPITQVKAHGMLILQGTVTKIN